MAEYISKEFMLKNLEADKMNNAEHCEPVTVQIMERFIRYVKEFPSADVQPVRCGYWKDIRMSEATGWDLSLTGGRDAVCETVCSVCGDCCAFGGDGDLYLSPYCPNCGAKMDLKDGEQNENN